MQKMDGVGMNGKTIRYVFHDMDGNVRQSPSLKLAMKRITEDAVKLMIACPLGIHNNW